MMQVTLWGTRGSVAAPGPETVRYGGNTSCVQVQGADGTLLVLDAGTGVRRLGATIPDSQRRIDILLTQLHLDHIQGLGFFRPLRVPGYEVHIWGPASTTFDLQDRLSRYLSPPLFPVYIRDMPSNVILHEIADDQFTIGQFKIAASPVIHHDPTLGFRISDAGGTVTYLPDHEPALGDGELALSGEWTSGYSLAEASDLLIHDAQYTVGEYEERVGWGHSAIPHAFRFAALAEVNHLVPFHHDPNHSDDELDRLHSDQIRSTAPPFQVTPGAEGMTFTVGE